MTVVGASLLYQALSPDVAAAQQAPLFRLSALFLVLAGAGLAALQRSGLLSSQDLLDVGLGFEIGGALALSLLEEALASLDKRYTHKKPEQQRRYELLRPRLDGSDDPRSHEEVADAIGVAVGAVRTATSRRYDEYEDRLRAVVSRHCGPECDVEAEMRWLRATFEALP